MDPVQAVARMHAVLRATVRLHHFAEHLRDHETYALTFETCPVCPPFPASAPTTGRSPLNPAAAERKLAAIFAKCSTPELVKALIELDAMPATPEHSWSRHAAIVELEDRFPLAASSVRRAYDAAGDDDAIDYVSVLVAAIPADQR